MAERTCMIEGCEKRAKSRGWCSAHYEQWRRHGDPEPARPSIDERFWSKVDRTGKCWSWTASKNPDGYGEFWDSGRLTGAHRWSFEAARGPIPVGLDLDHLCRNRACVNPAHLEPVSRTENVRRGVGHGSETHCPSGHPYDSANTYVSPRGDRQCRVCRARHRQRARAKVTNFADR